MHTRNNADSWAGTIFLLIILAAVYYISHRYLAPLAWTALIVIASWPLYQRLLRLCRHKHTLSAVIMTTLLTVVILLPISWLIISTTKEVITANHLLLEYNKTGIPMPNFVQHIPLYSQPISDFWQQYLSKPEFFDHGRQLLNQYHNIVGSYVQAVGAKTLYHSISFLIGLIALFFFFRDGETIYTIINDAGHNVLAERWQNYCIQLPSAIRSVVNGTVLVGIGVGLLMGISYAFAGIPVPALFGFATAILAMIPFGIVLVLTVVIFILIAKSSFVAAITILIWGTLVSFVSDHVIKPSIIGNSTKLPFLLILIGILGGVETLGLIGLFIGPIIMVLFYTLIEELSR